MYDTLVANHGDVVSLKLLSMIYVYWPFQR